MWTCCGESRRTSFMVPQASIESILTGCESPLETAFLDGLRRLLPGSLVVPQYAVATRAYSRRIDFAVRVGDDRVGIEVDGSQHLRKPDLDRIRDAVILAEQKVLWIYRIPGWMLRDNAVFAIECVSAMLPELLKASWGAFGGKMTERGWACSSDGRVTMIKKASLQISEPWQNVDSLERVCVGQIHNPRTLQREIAEVESLSTHQLHLKVRRHPDDD